MRTRCGAARVAACSVSCREDLTAEAETHVAVEVDDSWARSKRVVKRLLTELIQWREGGLLEVQRVGPDVR